MKTIKALLLIHFICLLTISTKAQDSIQKTSIQALELSADFGSYSSTFNREYSLLENLLLNQNGLSEVYPGYSNSYFHNGYTRFNVDLVFYSKELRLFNKYFKTEFKFGASYSFANASSLNGFSLWYDSINNLDFKLKKSVYLSYNTTSQQIQASYQVNTQSFAKNFKAYIGIGVAFSLNQWSNNKSIKNRLTINDYHQIDSFKYPIRIYDFNTFSALSITTWLPIGLKYNFSCDINFFTELKFGIKYTPKLSHAPIQNGVCFTLGMRYKFKQSELDKEKNNTFW